MTTLEQIGFAATVALGLTIGIALLNTWVIPTQDGVTFGIGPHGYHIAYEQLEGENHD